MKKRLLCLVLCLLTVLPLILTACADPTKSGTEGEEMTIKFSDSTEALTIVLYSICEEGTTDAAIARVQDAINDITETTYKTHVELRFYPETEYYKVLQEKMQVIQDQETLRASLKEAAANANKLVRSAGVTTSPELLGEDASETETGENAETTTYVEETVKNDLGFSETVYPEATANQMDIFLITDYATYTEYADAGLITDLSSELTLGSSVLSSYINPILLDGVKYDGNTYGVPTNHAIGDYEYILLNRELADKYYFDVNSITSMGDLADYLNIVTKYESDYTPLVNYGSLPAFYIDNEPSMVGAYIQSAAFKANGSKSFVETISPRMMFAFREFKRYYSTLYTYKNIITYADSIDGMDKVAAAVLKGDLDIPERYGDDYYVLTYRNPILYSDEAFSSVYAVSSYTGNLTRSMEIMRLFATNEDFCNTLRYGVSGVDYEVNKDGQVVKLNQEYGMNEAYAGNQFKLKQSTSMTAGELLLSADGWKLAKAQNLDAALDPYYGFILEEDPKVLKAKEAAENGEKTADEETTAKADDSESSESGDETATETEDEEYCSVEQIITKYRELYQDFLKRYEAFVPYVDEDGVEVDIDLFLTRLSTEYSAYQEVLDASNRSYNYSLTTQVEDWYKEKYGIKD